jgi:predicted TIM-barrel fold metal-dependent hydrolase
VVIFSLTAPGPTIAKGEAAVKLALETNEYFASFRDKHPSKYGFFATVPCLTDPSTAIAEITYALDVLKADGITLFTRYGPGNMYLGHATLKPLWKVLNERHAVVFIHPTHAVDTNLVSPTLPQPIVDYPHETTRTAVDLVMSNTKRENPNCKIILSHAGGTLPFLAKRAANLADTGMTTKTRSEILEDIGAFYFDLALSSSKPVIQMLLELTAPDHIMYGSDSPYAPTKTIAAFLREFEEATLGQNLEYAINRGNALRLFPRFEMKK